MQSFRATMRLVRRCFAEIERKIGKPCTLALIGGHAVIFHGVERTTRDVDLCARVPDGEAPRSIADAARGALARRFPGRFEITFHAASLDSDDSLQHDLLVIRDTFGKCPRIDCLFARYLWELDGIERAQVVAEIDVRVMPIPQVVAMKLLAASPRDDLDVQMLLRHAEDAILRQTHSLARRIKRDRRLRALLARGGG